MAHTPWDILKYISHSCPMVLLYLYKDKDIPGFHILTKYPGSQAYIKKGAHQFRFFLPTMHTPNTPIVAYSCMYAFFKWDPMCTQRCDGVPISIKMHTCMSGLQ